MPLMWKRKWTAPSTWRRSKFGYGGSGRKTYKAKRTVGLQRRRLPAGARPGAVTGPSISSTLSTIVKASKGMENWLLNIAIGPILNTGAGTFGLSYTIPQGVTSQARLGNSICCKYLDVNYTIAPYVTTLSANDAPNSFNAVRVLICIDKATNGTAPGLNGYLVNTADYINSAWSPDYIPDTLKPIYDTVHTFDQGHRITSVRKRLPLNGHEITYTGGAGSIGQAAGGHIFMLCIALYNDTVTLKNSLGFQGTAVLYYDP